MICNVPRLHPALPGMGKAKMVGGRKVLSAFRLVLAPLLLDEVGWHWVVLDLNLENYVLL